MKKTLGIWIDHRKAVLVLVDDKGLETRVVQSNVERQPGRFAGVRSTAHYEAHRVPADDSRERKFANDLSRYYDEVITALRDADSIMIFGPGEAKGELRKRLDRDKPDSRIVAIETVDKMTDNQIASKVREYYKN